MNQSPVFMMNLATCLWVTLLREGGWLAHRRWLAVDRGPMHLGNPQTLNRYAFVRNNPVNLYDPLGDDVADPSEVYNPWYSFGYPTYSGDSGNVSGPSGETDTTSEQPSADDPSADDGQNPAPPDGNLGPSADDNALLNDILSIGLPGSSPSLELDGTNGPITAVAGCNGPGVPCSAVQQYGMPFNGLVSSSPSGPYEWGSGEKFVYTIEDTNGDPVPGVSVTEWYQDANSPGSSWTNESTWSYGNGNCSTCLFQGSFTDFVGGGLNSAGFTYNQMFTVQVGSQGPNYLLTTQVLQYASPGPSVTAGAIVQVP